MVTRFETHTADRVAILILGIVTIIVALTFRDYGLGWDDYTHSQYGDLLLTLYRTGFADKSALSFVNLYEYGGGFDMAAALAAKILPFDLFETRRLIGAFVGLIGIVVTWRLARRLAGPIAGLSALILLVCCPLYYGHMFINAKDAPFATAMAILLLGLVRTIERYPTPGPNDIALLGLGLGTAFGSRILAFVAVPYVGLCLLLIVWMEIQRTDFRNATYRFGQFIWRLLPGFAIGYLIMGLLWPWSIVAPLNPVRALLYFDTFFEKPWKELYEGALVSVPQMPATYLVHLFSIKLPIVLLTLGLIGIVVTILAIVRRDMPLPRRATLLMILLAPTVPVVIAMIARPALYNGVRHFLFLVPPFAVLGGLAAAWLFERARKHSRVAMSAVALTFFAGIAVPVSGMMRIHPYQYVYFNALTGGVEGANGNYMLDYWGLAFKQAANALRAHVAAANERRPAGSTWVVVVCGPEAAAQIELGPDFKTSWTAKRADFVMSLGAFYCRALDAPVVAEVKRDGVIFARVYDLHGQAVPNLLTQAPP